MCGGATGSVRTRRINLDVAPSKPALLRQLGVISATALVISNMIGTGIFTSTGFLAGDRGSPGVVLWIWVVGALCGAFCYSEPKLS
jgi:APA family basic amino acid/polyamine antiporter